MLPDIDDSRASLLLPRENVSWDHLAVPTAVGNF